MRNNGWPVQHVANCGRDVPSIGHQKTVFSTDKNADDVSNDVSRSSMQCSVTGVHSADDECIERDSAAH